VENLEKTYKNKNALYFVSTREEMLNFIPGHCQRLLDIGCGEGNFGEMFKSLRGGVVHGVELDESAALKAKAVLDKVYVGNIDSLVDSIETSSYDVVTCNDVLEHLFDPYETLIKIKDKIIDSGFIVVSIVVNILSKESWILRTFVFLLKKVRKG